MRQLMTHQLPNALTQFQQIIQSAQAKKMILFLDFDGTLVPIIDRADQVVLSEKNRNILSELTANVPLSIISGRPIDDLKKRVGLENIIYSGNHGFEIDCATIFNSKPPEFSIDDVAIEKIFSVLQQQLGKIENVFIEKKQYSIVVHFRMLNQHEQQIFEPILEQSVNDVIRQYPNFKKHHGKKIFEIRPSVDWNKGKAVNWILESWHDHFEEMFPIYVGDDLTDEDAFKVLKRQGIGIVISDSEYKTFADYKLENVLEVYQFLNKLLSYFQRDRV